MKRVVCVYVHVFVRFLFTFFVHVFCSCFSLAWSADNLGCTVVITHRKCLHIIKVFQVLMSSTISVSCCNHFVVCIVCLLKKVSILIFHIYRTGKRKQEQIKESSKYIQKRKRAVERGGDNCGLSSENVQCFGSFPSFPAGFFWQI